MSDLTLAEKVAEALEERGVRTGDYNDNDYHPHRQYVYVTDPIMADVTEALLIEHQAVPSAFARGGNSTRVWFREVEVELEGIRHA